MNQALGAAAGMLICRATLCAGMGSSAWRTRMPYGSWRGSAAVMCQARFWHVLGLARRFGQRLWCLGSLIHAVVAQHGGDAQPIGMENSAAPGALRLLVFLLAPPC